MKNLKQSKLILITLISLLLSYLIVHNFIDLQSLESKTLKAKKPAQPNLVPPPTKPISQTYETLESLILVGDIGALHPDVFALLQIEAQKNPNSTHLLLLGDNLYPNGLPPSANPNYSKELGKLERILNQLKTLNVNLTYIPGNHDWENGSPSGWEAVLGEQKLIQSYFGPNSFSPKEACPGPELVSGPKHFYVIAHDSQWWLHNYAKPIAPDSNCTASTPKQIVTKLKNILSEKPKDKISIFIQHHPFESYGVHASTDPKHCPQNIPCPVYQNMLAHLERAFQDSPPLICVTGHEHNLEVLNNQKWCQNLLVSGSGSYHTPITMANNANFTRSELGLIRLDLLKDSRIFLQVLTYDKDRASSKTLYSTFIATSIKE